MNDRQKWDSRYRKSAGRPSTAQVLHDFAHLLPPDGEALDLAAGLGGNAQMLAARGLTTSAWDISDVAMEKLTASAKQQGLVIRTQVRDIISDPPEAESFDVIVVSRFLDRNLCPHLSTALCPGGLLFYQTFIREKTDPTIGPGNPDYLLKRNELLQLFPTLHIIAYREEGLVGQQELGLRNEAYLVAQKNHR